MRARATSILNRLIAFHGVVPVSAMKACVRKMPHAPPVLDSRAGRVPLSPMVVPARANQGNAVRLFRQAMPRLPPQL